MGLDQIALIAAALIPAIVLCVYIYRKDRVEKEPAGLLTLLFFLGAVICYPAAKLEVLAESALDSLFAPLIQTVDQVGYMDLVPYHAYQILYCVFGIALAEEGLKWLVLLLVTRKNKNFNSFFDGMIYAVFVSLGFAALENVFYVISNGWSTAVLRAFTAVPGHMFDSVFMGYYYSLWWATKNAKRLESELISKGLLHRRSTRLTSGSKLALSLLVPVLTHGLYDYLVTSDGGWLFNAIFYVLIGGLYVHCFRRINTLSKQDSSLLEAAAHFLYRNNREFQRLVDAQPNNPHT